MQPELINVAGPAPDPKPWGHQHKTTAQLEAEFTARHVRDLSRHDGACAALDVALHVLLISRLGASASAGLLASLGVAAAQGAWFAGARSSYLRHRLAIIAVRRLTAAQLLASLALPLTRWRPAAQASWPAMRLLLASSSAVVNLQYVLWFRTVMRHCFPLNLAAQAILMMNAPSVCAASLGTTGSAGAQLQLLRLARGLQRVLSLPGLLVYGPATLEGCAFARALGAGNASAAGQPLLDVPSPQSCDLARSQPGGGGGGGAADPLSLCAALVSATQLGLGIIFPAFILYTLEQRKRIAFVATCRGAAAGAAASLVTSWWAAGTGITLLLGAVWLLLSLQVVWGVLTEWHGVAAFT